MLQALTNVLSSKRIILASSSPRRREILKNSGLKVEIIPSTFVEDLDKSKFKEPYEYAIATAKGKANEVIDRLKTSSEHFDILISADTIVCKDGKIYEKPSSIEECIDMLSQFSGNTHTVCTGVCLVFKSEFDYNMTQFFECTEVVFPLLDKCVIHAYANTGEGLDKAGGYGIQSLGGSIIKSINGDYFNVMGLPLHSVCKQIYEFYKK